MKGNASSAVGGLIMAIGVVGLLVSAVSVTGYVARRWGLPGLAIASAVLTTIIFGVTHVEAGWFAADAACSSTSMYCLMGTYFNAAVRWPWGWILGVLWAQAIVIGAVAYFAPDLVPPASSKGKQ